MTNGTVSSTLDSEYHRAKCPACGTVCEQRCRWVLCDGVQRTAYDCLECEAIYLAATEPAPTDEPYGCVNRTIESPRECVESGHYWCDLRKHRPELDRADEPARGEP